jgi:NADH-quinone oxidoreductase subunit J
MMSIAFGVVAAAMLLAALMVATARNLVRGVLWLGAVLVSTAALYVLLAAPFLAGIQILLYAGGVMTLMIFGVMLTRTTQDTTAEQRGRLTGAIAAAALFGTVAGAIVRTTPSAPSELAPPTTADLGRELLGTHVLAFEVLSLLLLAAMIGAVVLSRRKDPSQETPRPTARTAAAAQSAEPAKEAAE